MSGRWMPGDREEAGEGFPLASTLNPEPRFPAVNFADTRFFTKRKSRLPARRPRHRSRVAARQLTPYPHEKTEKDSEGSWSLCEQSSGSALFGSRSALLRQPKITLRGPFA